MIPSGYSSRWYIFYLCYLKKEDRDPGYNNTVNSFPQTKGVEHFWKMVGFQGGFEVLHFRWGVATSTFIFQGDCRCYCRATNNFSRTIGQNVC